MKEIPQVSIIIPIYNAGKYLRKCIESIIDQSFKEFELLLVDDGSTDTSKEICNEYAKKDSRIAFFSKENEGVTATRKYGVDQSIGEYICFVDADDELPVESLASLIENCDDTDIVVGSYKEINNDKGEIKQFHKEVPSKLNGFEFIRLQLENKLYHAPWAKIIKRSCFDNTTFDIPRTIFRGEDYLMNIRLGLKANKIKVIHRVVYNYMVRESSCMQTRKPSLEYEIQFDSCLTQPLREKKLYDLLKKSILQQRVEALTGLILSKCKIDKNDPFVKSICNESNLLSGDLKQILVKVVLPYPTLFRLSYRTCRRLKLV